MNRIAALIPAPVDNAGVGGGWGCRGVWREAINDAAAALCCVSRAVDAAVGPPEGRFLTPRECCRIQGFLEDYNIPSISRDGDESTAHFYAGIGNAVVPPVVSSIGKEIIACLFS